MRARVCVCILQIYAKIILDRVEGDAVKVVLHTNCLAMQMLKYDKWLLFTNNNYKTIMTVVIKLL